MEAVQSRKPTTVNFGLFEFNLAARQLRKQGRVVKLQDLPLRLLISLLEKPGELVAHEALQQALWGDTTINFDDGLHTAVRKLREALGDSATNPRFIATVPRRGYRFIAPVSSGDDAGKLRAWSSPSRLTTYLAIAGTLAVVAAFTSLWLHASRGRGSTLSNIVPLTSYPGMQRSPRLSPDGRRVAFVWAGPTGDNLAIYVRAVNGGAPLRITSGGGSDDFPVWSPDGNSIAFTRSGFIYVTPSAGGSERKLTGVAGNGLSWSPDGSLLAFSGQNSKTEPVGIFVFALATGQRRRVTAPGAPARDEFPAFSWNSKEIAFVRKDTTLGDVLVTSVAGGNPARRLTAIGEPITGVSWTPDNKFLIFGDKHGLFRVPARVSAPQPSARIVTTDDSARQPAIWRNPQSGQSQLVFARAVTDSDILRIPVGQSGSKTEAPVAPVPVAASTLADHGPSISPDGTKIAFSSGRTGTEEIWTCDADGADPQQLTFFDSGLGATCPSWSPDGKSIAFDATVHGNRDIYLIRAEGGQARRLTNQPTADAQPSWSHDGQWIYFMSARSGTHQIWKMRADGGEPKQLTTGGGYQALESPDGKLLFYVRDRGEHGVWSVPVNGGSEVPVLETAWHNAWAVSAKGIYYLDFDHATSSAVPVNRFDILTRNIVTVAKVPPPITRGVPAFAVSPDGRWLTWVASNDRQAGLMLVRDFRW